MNELIGKITATLVEKEGHPPDDLVEKINLNINPPEKVTAENVYIRAMYIVSDKVNSFGGKFPVEEQARLLPLLIDTPVLVGHRKDSLPIARNFHAELVSKGDVNWIKAYFYWLKNAEGAESLKNNIDGGIYKECSISFVFAFPECSICGSDIRRCGHRPFQKYIRENIEEEAHFNYRRIEKVLETSLVYRGAVPDTSLTNELLLFTGDSLKGVPAPPLSPRNRIWDLSRFKPGNRFLVSPAYESLRVILEKNGENVHLYDVRGREILTPIVVKYIKGLSLPSGDFQAEGRLLGYRGKERRPVRELVLFLRGEKSNIRRLELKLAELISHEGNNLDSETLLKRRQLLESAFADQEVLLLPAAIASSDNRGHILTRLATRLGLEMTDLDDGRRYLYSPARRLTARVRTCETRTSGFKYNLEMAESLDDTPGILSVFSTEPYKVGDILVLEFPPSAVIPSPGDFPAARIIDYCADYDLPDRLETKPAPQPRQNNCYRAILTDDGDYFISLPVNNAVQTFKIINFSLDGLHAGRRFLAESGSYSKKETNGDPNNLIINRGDNAGTLYLELAGAIVGRYAFRPVRINGRGNFLFYRVENPPSTEAPHVL